MSHAEHVVGGPEGTCLGSIAGPVKFRRQPGLARIGTLIHDAPRLAAGEAVNRVFLRAVVERQLILLALPGEPAGADAVGKGKEDRDAAACRAAVVEELRIAVKQVELLPFV